MAGATVTPRGSSPLVQIKDDGIYIGSGKSLEIASGGSLFIDGTDYTTILTNALQGSGAASVKMVSGTVTPTAATAAVVTGLSSVTQCVASLKADATGTLSLVTATEGDQAGTPAAGSIIVKLWMTDYTASSVVAATTFGAVHWVALGT